MNKINRKSNVINLARVVKVDNINSIHETNSEKEKEKERVYIQNYRNPKNARKEMNIERKNKNEKVFMKILRNVFGSIQMNLNHFIQETNLLIGITDIINNIQS